MRALAKVTGREIRAFAYPFGGPAAPQTAAILRQVGIRVACTARSEAVTRLSDPLALPRLHVKDWGKEEFLARVESFLDG